MTRECIRKLEDEFLKIDKYLEKYERKYGTVFHNGFEYIACEPEECETTDSGKTVYTGSAYCTDGIYVEERLDPDETEDVDQVNIHVDVYHYERDSEGEVMFMDRLGTLKWKGGYLGS